MNQRVSKEKRQEDSATCAATSHADDPETDGTDFAHPAWWRGNDRGVEAVCEIVERILDGKDTEPLGRFGYLRLETLRQRLLALVAR